LPAFSQSVRFFGATVCLEGVEARPNNFTEFALQSRGEASTKQ